MILARAPIFFWVKPYLGGGPLDLVFFLLVHELRGAALSISLADS